MAYRHGVYASRLDTSVIPTRETSCSIPFVLGVAPVHKLAEGSRPVNEIKMISTYSAFAKKLGWDDALAEYSLCEFAKVYFSLYTNTPAFFVNVFDPAVHKTTVSEPESHAFDTEGLIKVGRYGLTGVVVKSSDSLTTYVLGTDYSLDGPGGVLTRKTAGAIAAGATVKLTYTYGDPSKVTSADIIGGVTNGKKTGLELLDMVFPTFRELPGLIVAPGFSTEPSVAILMASKGTNVNGHFRPKAIVDLPESLIDYSDCPGWKNDKNLTDENMVVCWPRLKYGAETHWMSSHLAALYAATDADNGDIPYETPSNKRFLVEGAIINGTDVWLTPEEANYLNGQGIVTALNFIGGWRCWGGRTAAYPDNTDVIYAYDCVNRMFDWLNNKVILTFWSKVDKPMTRRWAETVIDSCNIWLNGLAAKQYILGGRLEFNSSENATTDLMDGISYFHLWATPPSPAREINFLIEYDPDYLSTLFGES